MRITRSFLAVPATQERMIANAAASDADAVFIDLEDTVPLDQKEIALDSAIRALNVLDWGNKTVCVRVNVPGSDTVAREIRRLASEVRRLDTLLIPKCESAADVAKIEELLRPFNAVREVPVRLELLIETAKGVAYCESIAAQSTLTEALHFGVGDFSASLGARGVDIGISPPNYRMTSVSEDGRTATTPMDLWMYPMMRILIAARAHGLRAIDGPCGAFRDPEMTSGSALKAATMGFDGKQVIHPGQIQVTNEAFLPSEAEVVHARRVEAALAKAEAEGKGAIQVDGKLVDYANIRMAKRTLDMALYSQARR